ncbi:peptide deformylase [Serratia sp. PF2-63]|uniref:peptide deformylase n=1 Tax=Enterobacterales TaxID=91347 RepID=UPI0024AF1D04|nr:MULTISPECIES: peptide deformylase [Enterobacterales]MDI6934682.1 peptide deformylase [Serratia sp. Se-PFBMAAmG]MDI9223641.1 peptide deformylase [Pantoea sp. EA-12]MDI9265887.1 peptide deformylase [Serratia sp. PF2-63]MDI9267145.1 peptide deformylase [Serratia sp. PF-27]
MAVKNIRQFPDPVLRKRAKPVEIFDEQLVLLTDDLKDTMYHYDGIGLSAPQLGVSLRVIAIMAEGKRSGAMVLINPVLKSVSRQRSTENEGCLSMNAVWCPVSRPVSIIWCARDVYGNHIEGEADGWLARAIMHETDHLNGILISDYQPVKFRQKIRRGNPSRLYK